MLIKSLSAADVHADPDLLTAIVSLNNAHAVELSFADKARMELLISHATWAARIGRVDGLLLAFDQDADYDSPNFAWFSKTCDRFVYIDRIVTAAPARGKGIARHLYDDLFTKARAVGHERVVCEINSNPPNPASERFHRALGFEQVGEALLENGKTVSYMACQLTP